MSTHSTRPTQAPRKEFLVLERHLNASPMEAYRAWSDPDELGQWWGPDEGDRNVVIDIDVKEGGSYHIVTQAPNGDQYDFQGRYEEVIPGRLLKFTWDTGSEKEGSTVTAELKSDGDGTALTLTHQGLGNVAEREGCRKGWQGALNKLSRQLRA